MQVVGCAGCTRWLLVPWLVIYLCNILLLSCLALAILLIPVHSLQQDTPGQANIQAIRAAGVIPLIMAAALAYFWLVIRYTQDNL